MPYQFKLIAHVFEAFQQLKYVIKEAKDNECSALGITHCMAKQHADRTGDLHALRCFLQSAAAPQSRSALVLGELLRFDWNFPKEKENPFAQKVVKTFFADLRNLLESQRQTFPSNIDNLTILLMDELDQNKMQLQKKDQGGARSACGGQYHPGGKRELFLLQ